MLTEWDLLSIIGCPILLGWAILRLIGLRRRDDLLAQAGYAWLAGTLVIATLIQVALLCQLPLEARWLAPTAVGLAGITAAVAWWRGRRREPGPETALRSVAPPSSRPASWAFALSLTLCVGASLDRSIVAATEPMRVGDETFIWRGKAAALYTAGGFNDSLAAFVARGPAYLPHLDYPAFDPSLQVWVDAHRGHLSHIDARVPIQGFEVALLCILAAAMRRRAGPWLAALLLPLYIGQLSTRSVGSAATADVMLAATLLGAVDAALRWLEDGDRRWGVVAILALTGAVWSKNEGLMLYLVFLVTVLGLAGFRRWRGDQPAWELGWWWRRASLPLLAAAATWAFSRRFGLVNDLLGQNPAGTSFARLIVPQFAHHAPIVLAAFVRDQVLAPGFTRLTFLFCAAAQLGWIGRRAPLAFRCGSLVVLGGLAGYFLVFVGTYLEVNWHLETAAWRTFFHLMPVALLTTASGLAVRPAAGR